MIPGHWSVWLALKQGLSVGSADGRPVTRFVVECIPSWTLGGHVIGHWLVPGWTGSLGQTTTETFTDNFAYISF